MVLGFASSSLQMLNIHERRQCGIPVIIEGETGVGKTALISMLSKLWNHALINEWRTVKGRIIEMLYLKSLGRLHICIGSTVL